MTRLHHDDVEMPRGDVRASDGQAGTARAEVAEEDARSSGPSCFPDRTRRISRRSRRGSDGMIIAASPTVLRSPDFHASTCRWRRAPSRRSVRQAAAETQGSASRCSGSRRPLPAGVSFLGEYSSLSPQSISRAMPGCWWARPDQTPASSRRAARIAAAGLGHCASPGQSTSLVVVAEWLTGQMSDRSGPIGVGHDRRRSDPARFYFRATNSIAQIGDVFPCRNDGKTLR